MKRPAKLIEYNDETWRFEPWTKEEMDHQLRQQKLLAFTVIAITAIFCFGSALRDAKMSPDTMSTGRPQ